MGFHSYRGDFLKGYDRYAKAVSLTYLRSGTYRTHAGGICTMIGFCLLFYWVCVNVFYALHDYGTYSTSESIKLSQGADGTYPLYSIDAREFLITYDIVDVSTTNPITDEDELERYASGIWV